MAEQEQFDTEITLGVGRLLVLFFGLVVLCGIFMGIGYSLGRNSAKAIGGDSATTVTSASGKPTPSSVIKPPDSTSQSSTDLSFYKSVEQKEPDSQLKEPERKPDESKPATAPEIKAGAVPGSGYMVQIAAVSKKEDADALVDALRHKQYPVFVTAVPGDKLFHVQIGPFPDTKDAESVRSRLMADGYNPILKR
jgi:cell division septation protein DedD